MLRMARADRRIAQLSSGMRRLLLGVALLLVLAACGQSSSSTTTTSVPQQRLPYTVLGTGDRLDTRQAGPHGVIARDRATVVDALGSGAAAPLWLARFPFQQDAVVLVFAGTATGSGRDVAVTDVELAGSKLIVQAKVKSPAPDEIRPAVVTDPYEALQIANADLGDATAVEVVLTR